MRSVNQDSDLPPQMLQAAQGAAHWLATLTDENCSADERRQFLEWLRYSVHHVDEFLKLSTLARSASKRELWSRQSIQELAGAARDHASVTTLGLGLVRAMCLASTSITRLLRVQNMIVSPADERARLMDQTIFAETVSELHARYGSQADPEVPQKPVESSESPGSYG